MIVCFAVTIHINIRLTLSWLCHTVLKLYYRRTPDLFSICVRNLSLSSSKSIFAALGITRTVFLNNTSLFHEWFFHFVVTANPLNSVLLLDELRNKHSDSIVIFLMLVFTLSHGFFLVTTFPAFTPSMHQTLHKLI